MIETVLLTVVDELCIIPRKEGDGMLRFHIFIVCLSDEHSILLTSQGMVAHQFGTVLFARMLHHIDILAARAPGDVGEIAVSGITGLQVDGLSCSDVIDSHRHLVAGRTGHGILVGYIFSRAGFGIHLRIVAHHRLVHAVESQTLAVRTPEGSLLDTKLIAVHHLSALDACRFIGHLHCLSIGRHHPQVVIDRVSKVARRLVPIHIGRLLCYGQAPHHATRLPIEQQVFTTGMEQHLRFVGIRERHTLQRMYRLLAGSLQPTVHLIKFHQHSARFLTPWFQYCQCVHIQFHTLVTPPRVPCIWGSTLTIGFASRNEVVQGKRFLFLCHSGKGKQQ